MPPISLASEESTRKNLLKQLPLLDRAGMPRPASLTETRVLPFSPLAVDLHRPAGGRVLDRVRDQVLDDLRDPLAVAERCRAAWPRA